MTLQKLTSFIALFASVLTVNAKGIEFYVSKDGSDINPGTKEQPVATLNGARDLIRGYKSINGTPSEDITVWVSGGDYQHSSPFILNQHDSGSPEHKIIWRAVEGGKVNLSGGITLPSDKFKKIPSSIKSRLTKEAASKVVCINLKELGITNYGEHKQIGHSISIDAAPMELFIDAEPMRLAQYPNSGFVAIGEVIDGGSVPRIGDYTGRGATFKYDDPQHKVWAESDDVWFQGTFATGYADDKIKVKNIDTKLGQVTLSTPHLYGVQSGKDFQRYIVLNVLDELDQEGEWYLDRNEGILYVWPKTDILNSKVEVSLLEEPIVCMEGVSNIIFRNFTIESGRGIGIYIENGTNNLLAGCTIRNIGTTGVSFGQGAYQTTPHITVDDYEGVPRSRIIGNYTGHIYKYTTWDRHAGKNHKLLSCDIYNTGSGGVILSGGSKKDLIPGNNTIENCKIHDYNRHNKFRWAGIIVDGCGNKISHNEVYNSDYHGIFSVGPEHIFEYNNVHHVTLNSNDVSPWYTGRDPSDRGLIVRYNYFHDCGNKEYMTMGIYCDDSSTGITVFGNVFYNMHTGHGVLYSNSGWDLVMKNNIIINPQAATVRLNAHYYTWYQGGGPQTFKEGKIFDERLNKAIDITKPPYSDRYPELANYMDPIIKDKEWEGMHPRRNVFSTNVVVNSPLEDPVERIGEHSQFESFNNMITNEDPGFEDFKNNNFKLRSDSPVFKEVKGFEPIPFDEIGLYSDEYRD